MAGVEKLVHFLEVSPRLIHYVSRPIQTRDGPMYFLPWSKFNYCHFRTFSSRRALHCGTTATNNSPKKKELNHCLLQVMIRWIKENAARPKSILFYHFW
jgi:hypothetical protein